MVDITSIIPEFTLAEYLQMDTNHPVNQMMEIVSGNPVTNNQLNHVF